jgi:histidyl-tRNA synthetase
VLMTGETEINTGTISFKNLQTKEQGSIPILQLAEFLNSSIN